jgi:hypothetical protein
MITVRTINIAPKPNCETTVEKMQAAHAIAVAEDLDGGAP